MELPARFRFTDARQADVEPASHLVRIGSGLRRKRELFACYDRALRLPDYFGWNWDALEEFLPGEAVPEAVWERFQSFAKERTRS